MTTSLRHLRRLTSELLACAVLEMFPEALLVEGDATEFGFFYDFISPQPIDSQAIPWLEEKIRGFIKQDIEIRSLDMMRENAAVLFDHKKQPFKEFAVRDARENIVQILQIGALYDYPAPAFVPSVEEIGAFKLLNIETVTRYLPSEGHISVIRISGIACHDKQELKRSLKAIEAGKRANHESTPENERFLEIESNLNPFACFWNEKGFFLRRALLDFWQDQHIKQKFNITVSPPLMKQNFLRQLNPKGIDVPTCEIQGEEFAFTSSALAFHVEYFKSLPRKAVDLPLRLAECSYTYNSEPSHLWGALKADLVYVDEAHLFCRSETVVEELISSLQFIAKITKIFSLGCYWHLKGRPHKFAGTENAWLKGIESFKQAFDACDIPYRVEEQEGAFVGPMAQAYIIDSMGREWKGPSLNINLLCPVSMDLSYLGNKGEKLRPILLQRSLFGSLERFTTILVEHYGGRFPLWLAPEQVRVIAVTEDVENYAKNIETQLQEHGFRAAIDGNWGALGTRVRAAEDMKVPYIVVVGTKEENKQLITVRSDVDQQVLEGIELKDFILQLQQEVTSKEPRKQQERKARR